MKKSVLNQVLVVLVILLTISLLFVTFHDSSLTNNGAGRNQRHPDHHGMLQLINLQNETIALMEQQLMRYVNSGVSRVESEVYQAFHPKNVAQLTLTNIEASSSILEDYRVIETSDMEKSCEDRYGLSLVGKWRENKQVWCSEPTSTQNEYPSELSCYRYHQAHKKLDGRGPDLFCVAKNFVIDFSKV